MPLVYRDDNIRVILRYALIQLPGIVLVVAALLAIHYFVEIPLWVALAVIAVWIIKDIAMFPFTKDAYSGCISGSASSMLGMKGKVMSTLSPVGSVRVRGEIWQARTDGRQMNIERGQTVQVTGRSGLTLLVEPYRDNGQAVEDKKGSVRNGRRNSANE